MPEPLAAARTGAGPSAPDAVPHGLRVRAFGLLPEKRPAAWAEHVAGVWDGLRPTDALEQMLATALAAAAWQEIRADRCLAETMAEIAPVAQCRSHGSDFSQQHHAAAMGTAMCFATAAGMATARAQGVPPPPQGRARRAAGAAAGGGAAVRGRQPEPQPGPQETHGRARAAPTSPVRR